MELNLYFYRIYLNYYKFLKVWTLFESFKWIQKEKRNRLQATVPMVWAHRGFQLRPAKGLAAPGLLAHSRRQGISSPSGTGGSSAEFGRPVARYWWGWDPGASCYSEGSPCTVVDDDELGERDKSGNGLDNGSSAVMFGLRRYNGPWGSLWCWWLGRGSMSGSGR
jgi:hypothetical protein